MQSTVRILLFVLLAMSLTGCQLVGLLVDSTVMAFSDDPPRLNTNWAIAARQVRSSSTPNEEVLDIQAEYGPEADREEDELCDLDGDEDLGRVVVVLGEGVYELWDETVLTGADEVEIRGQGPHKTRLSLRTDAGRSLVIAKTAKVRLSNMTVVAYEGGGIFIEECPDVRVRDVHFAGSSVGLGLASSTADVGSSVFAGCSKGIRLRGGTLTVRESAFKDCWRGIEGKGVVHLESNAFVDNHSAVPTKVDPRSTVISCLFSGSKQELGWKGRPRVVRANLTERRDLGKAFEREINLAIASPDDFPDGVRFPAGFDMPGVHLALERWSQRGEEDPTEAVTGAAYAGAERFAKAAQKALAKGNVAGAQAVLKVALKYWGDRPLSEAPEALLEIQDLAK